MEEKKNLESKNSNKKKTLIIVLAVLVVALIALAIINSANNKGIDTSDTANTGTNQTATSQTDTNAVTPVTGDETATKPATSDGVATPSTPAANETPATDVANVTTGGAVGTTATKPEAPIEKTNPITIKMAIDFDKGFNPASFDVKAGQQVTLTVSANGGVAILVFDGGLSATATGISNGQTKDITFTAPVTRGAYSFHNDIPGKNQTCKINVK